MRKRGFYPSEILDNGQRRLAPVIMGSSGNYGGESMLVNFLLIKRVAADVSIKSRNVLF